jgi:hypothetical protein
MDCFHCAVGLVTAVQAAHEDLKAQKGAVLVTGGGLSLETDESTAGAFDWGCASLGIAKAAQRKLVHIMHKALAADGIYVAEVTVMGGVSRPLCWLQHCGVTSTSHACMHNGLLCPLLQPLQDAWSPLVCINCQAGCSRCHM